MGLGSRFYLVKPGNGKFSDELSESIKSLSVTIPNLTQREFFYTTPGMGIMGSYPGINLYLRNISSSSF